jgi:hypothetical protein
VRFVTCYRLAFRKHWSSLVLGEKVGSLFRCAECTVGWVAEICIQLYYMSNRGYHPECVILLMQLIGLVPLEILSQSRNCPRSWYCTAVEAWQRPA